MLSYRAIQNLKSLSKKELSEFNKWLKPGWANSNKKLYELFIILRGFYPTFTSQKLTKKHLFKKLYPEKVYHEKELLNLLSKLSRAIESFLAHRHLRENPELQANLLIEIKRHRSFSKEKEPKQIRSKILQLEKRPIKTILDLQELIKLNKLQAEAITPRSGDADKKPFLLKVNQYLDQYYALSKARNAMRLLEREKKFGEKSGGVQWYTEIPVSCKSLPSIRFYEQYAKAGKSINLAQFKKLQNLFYETYDQINLKDQRIIYLLLVNTAARIKNKGFTEVLKYTMKLNHLAVQIGFIFENDLITPHSFANVINVACQQRQFAFAQDFLESHTKYLPPDMQQDGKDWGQLLINYKQGTPNVFQQATILDNHKRAYTVFSLRIRVLITQILFDAYHKDMYKADDRFEFHIDAFERKLLREKKYSQKHIEGLKIFHKYCKILASYFPAFQLTKIEAEDLRQKINGEGRIHAKAWLMEKIAEMEKGNHSQMPPFRSSSF